MESRRRQKIRWITLRSDWTGGRTLKNTTTVSIGCWLFKWGGDRSLGVVLLMRRQRRWGVMMETGALRRKASCHTSEWMEKNLTLCWTETTDTVFFSVNQPGIFNTLWFVKVANWQLVFCRVRGEVGRGKKTKARKESRRFGRKWGEVEKKRAENLFCYARIC